MTNTQLHLSAAYSDEKDAPTIKAYLFEAKGNVTLDIGDPGSGVYSVQLTPSSARKLGRYLEAFADTADGVPAHEGDPTRDAPPLTDADAPETVAA